MPRSFVASAFFAALIVLTLDTSNASAAPETLVVKAADGTFQPGAASSWSEAGGVVRFVLGAGVDGTAVAGLLRERLAGADVKLEGGALLVSGIPMPSLLEQVCALSLSGEGDPLAGLASLGGSVVATGVPEGGGSIRASKPTALLAQVNGDARHDASERLEAEVLEVQRGAFPNVTLKMKVRRSAKNGPLMKKLSSGKVFAAAVLFTSASGSVDFSIDANQRNVVAFHLQRGDRVFVHPVADGEVFSIDWIERKPK